jgi:hypothetical protein
MWSFELMVLLSGLLPNPELETSVLSIRLVLNLLIFVLGLNMFDDCEFLLALFIILFVLTIHIMFTLSIFILPVLIQLQQFG